jgi:beta-phosphoglucomutase family hydrolase
LEQISKVTPQQISPEAFDAVLFDMDGVVTRTAAVHFRAWKKTFDQFLDRYKTGEAPFTQEDYLKYVDGKPREDGVRDFLASRKILLTEEGEESVQSVAKEKNQRFLELIHEKGVEPYETTVAFINQLRKARIKTALVTASKNGAEILDVTKLGSLFDTYVTGVETEKLHLKGKPAPDTFLQAAKQLGVEPDRSIVVEDAEAGVESAKKGGFGMVIGVARSGNGKALAEHGADIVVRDLGEVLSELDDFSNCSKNEMRQMALSDLDVTKANWIVSYDNYNPDTEMKRESLCTLGNGYFFTRGAASDAVANEIHYPGTYIAGAYNTSRLGPSSEEFDREELVNMPNWLPLTFSIDGGAWFSIDDVEIADYSQNLDLQQGILYREVKFKDSQGRETSLRERRFVHMHFSHLAGQEIEIEAKNWSGILTLKSEIDGSVTNSGDTVDPDYKHTKHLKVIECDAQGNELFLKASTTDSGITIALASKISAPSQPDLEWRERCEDERAITEADVNLSEGSCILFEKICAVYTSRDHGIYEAGSAAREEVDDAPSFDILIERQIDTWRTLWQQFDLFLEASEEHSKLVPSLLLHLNSFHCLQTASAHSVDLDTGIPARGWTGEGYQGHIFWDDLFVFPFINLRMPDISAALLKYRHRRLPEARKIAHKYRAKGACFPWQSASNGKERTPNYWWMKERHEWIRDYTHLEIHVNGAIAYNIWQYYQVTLDHQFMYSFGAEMLMEIARFFASYARYNREKERYEITGVIGPDEFHNGYPDAQNAGVDNNAYTNILASWTICRALELLDQMPSDHSKQIKSRLHIYEDEIQLWNDVSRKLFLPIMKNGLLSQFEGFEDLKEFPVDAHDKGFHKELKAKLKEHRGYLNEYKLSKQADVLMLGFLFSPGEIEKLVENLGYPKSCVALEGLVDYYWPRTANESTLSRVAHSWVLSRLERLRNGNHRECQELHRREEHEVFYEALGSDYYDVASRGTAKTGIHMGAMAGTVDIAQRCYTGLETRDDVLWLDPKLPPALVRLSFSLHYRGQSIGFDIFQDKMKVHARHSSAMPIKIGFENEVHELRSGDYKSFELDARGNGKS